MTKSVAIIGTRGYPSYYGGFETAVRKLAPYLAERGWAVTVYGRAGGTRPLDPERDHRVRSVETRGIENKSLSTLTHGLTAFIHAVRNKPDVALVMNVANGFWLPLFWIRRIPTVVNVDGIEWERAKWGKLAKLVFRAGAWVTARLATTLISDAEEIRRRWLKDFHRDSVFIPYGGDVPEDSAVEDGLIHRGYVLMVARFVPENTVDEFLSATEDLAKEYPVVIVGSSGYGSELDTRAGDLTRNNANVYWLGHLSDDERLHSLWRHAGAYFHGHSVGGTNPALVQSMACGSPIVARDTVYNREVLDGTDAMFVAPDPSEIREAVFSLMRSTEMQDKISHQVRLRAEDAYSWEIVCSKYERTLHAHRDDS